MYKYTAHKWIAAVLVLGCTAFLYMTYLTAKPYTALKENVFRLHIVANSDMEADQELKLAVRDALLPAAKEAFARMELSVYAGENTAQKTAIAAFDILPLLEDTVKDTLSACGSDQKADIKVAYEAFPQKSYQDITMPAGDYWCLKVVLGEGKGQNWWCVLYPPLCILPVTAEDCFDAAELELLYQADQYRFRLAILDWLDKLKSKYR